MKLKLSCILFFGMIFQLDAQHLSTDTIFNGTQTENIVSRRLFSDSLCSSFLVSIKNEIKVHKHVHHSEQVVVISGSAVMSLGDSVFTMKKGDVSFIPANTWHGARTTSAEPFRVISIQAPQSDGTDRVYK